MERPLFTALEFADGNSPVSCMATVKTVADSRGGTSIYTERAIKVPKNTHGEERSIGARGSHDDQPAVGCKKDPKANRRQRVGRQSHSKSSAGRNGGKKSECSKDRGKMAVVKSAAGGTAGSGRREHASLSVDSGRGEELSSSCESTVFELLPLSVSRKQPHCSSEAEEEVYQDCVSHFSSEASSIYCTPLSTPHAHCPSPLPPSSLHSLDHNTLCDSLGKVVQDRHLESCDSHVTVTDHCRTPDDQPPQVERQSLTINREESQNSNCSQKYSSFFIGDIELQFDSDNQHDEGVDFEVFSPIRKHSREAAPRKRVSSSGPGILSVPPSHGRLTSNRHSFEFSSISTASPQSSVCTTSHPPSPLTLSPSPTTETAREPVFSMFDDAGLSKYDIEFMQPELESAVVKRSMVYAHTLEEQQQAEAAVEAVREEEEKASNYCHGRVLEYPHQKAAVKQQQHDEWPDLSSPHDVTPVPDNSPILAEEAREAPPLPPLPPPPPSVLAAPRYSSQVPWFHDFQLHHPHHPHHPPPAFPLQHPSYFPYPVSQAVQTGFYPIQTGFWLPPPYPPRPMFSTESYLPPFCQQSQAAHYLNPSQASNFVPATSTAELEVLPTPLEAAAPSPEEADIFSEERDAPELDQTAIATDQTRPEEETRQPDKETRQPDEDTIPDLESGEDCALPEESLMGVATEPSVAEVCRGVLETIHPLHATWVMWYDQITTNNRSQLCDYEASLKTVSTVGCVEDFWRLCNNIVQPSELGKNATYHFFKKNIKPLWEHPANKNGGKWVLTVKDDVKLLDKAWMELLLSLIGEQMPQADLITGAVVSRRRKGDRIALWTNKKEKKHNLEICTNFIKVLAQACDVATDSLPGFIRHLSECSNGMKLEFMHHTDSLRSHSSYKNDARISVRDHSEGILKSLTKS